MELRYNMKMFAICLYPLSCLLMMFSVQDVAGLCNRPGHFGTHCRYQCHCGSGSDDCNRNTGVCSFGRSCASGYYGNNCQMQNVALKKPADQSSTYNDGSRGSYVSYPAALAVDGNSSTNFGDKHCTHTREISNSWWYVDLEQEYNIGYIRVYNREGFQRGLRGFDVRIGSSRTQLASSPICYQYPNTTPPLVVDVTCYSVMRGRYVSINLGSGRDALTLCEVQVFVCTSYSFGANCMQTCNCRQWYYGCNAITGHCSSGCAAGFQGEDCKTACDNNRYGDSCASSCNANCILSSGSRTCHHVTGHCSNGCQSGYQGDFCITACDNNRYGDSCAPSCNANCILSSGSRTCHHVTGHCSNGCQSGYQGDFCITECGNNKYGDRCATTCNANCRSSSSSRGQKCHHVTGSCSYGCQPGFQGSFCNTVCTGQLFGANCAHTCNCKHRNEECNKVTGACSSGCAAGFHGVHCKTECDINRYGDRCASSCNANCILSSGSRTCQHVRGHCSNGCQSGYQGDFCNTECDINRYGNYCSSACNDNCMLSPGRRTCEHATGHCRNGCQPGYQGRFCNTVCTGQLFGANCAHTCNCKHWNEECNKVTGACSSGCAAGFQGVRCKTKCNINRYGEGCASTCNANCRLSHGRRACNHVTGRCTYGCQPGYHGSLCTAECPINRHGAGCTSSCNANCRSTSTYRGRTCDHVTGQCSNGCQAGYHGHFCASECILDYYGDCRTKCSKHCITIDSGQRQCNFISGDCTNTTGCQPGYIGSKCDQECSLNYYGDCRTNCSEHCITVDGRQRQCNFIYGDCTNTTGCQTGYIGSKCDQECSNVTYGVGCNKNCSDQCLMVHTSERVCSHETGACTRCIPGYNGTSCDQRCFNGYYGETCKFKCSENCDSFQNTPANICDYIAGHCLSGCTPGYQGNLCIDECDSGTYGLNCKSVCNENCQPTENEVPVCHHITGTCTSGCQDGYILNSESLCTMSLTLAPRNAEHDSLFDGDTIAGIAIGCLLGVALVATLIAAFVIIYKLRRTLSKATTMQVSHGPDQHTYQDLIPHPQEAAEHVAETVIEFETSLDVEGSEYCEISEIIATDSQHEEHVNGTNESGVYLNPHTYTNADQGPYTDLGRAVLAS